METSIQKILVPFIQGIENFTPTAKWDYKQYSNGYGTKAKYAGETISKEEAVKRMLEALNSAYNQIKPLVKTNLNPNQWAALISFTYNAGIGNADNLIPNINKRDFNALTNQMRLYNKATENGKLVTLKGLVNRRQKEVDLFNGSGILLSAIVPVIFIIILFIILK